jgi:nitrogen regulatory protein PII
MRRIEVIANRSVQEELIEALEHALPDFFYTVVPVVHGRGRQKRRLGTATWPEENFLLLAYVRDEDRAAVGDVVASVKRKYPKEGIKVFSSPADD